MLRYPAVSGARLDRLPNGLQRDAGFRAQHQPLADCGSADKPQQIRQQLDGCAVSGRSNVKDFFTKHIEDRPVLLKTLFRPADENGQLSQRRKIDRIGDRGLQKVNLPRRRQFGQLPHQVNRAGGSVDDRCAGPHRSQNACFSQHHLANLRRSWQGSNHYVGTRRSVAETGGPICPKRDQIRRLGRHQIEDRHRVTGLDQIGGHRVSHIADTHKKQAGFRGHQMCRDICQAGGRGSIHAFLKPRNSWPRFS